MNCPHCAAIGTKKQAKKTKLGYSPFFCPQCGRPEAFIRGCY